MPAQHGPQQKAPASLQYPTPSNNFLNKGGIEISQITIMVTIIKREKHLNETNQKD
jgi:hypothetical protein